MRLMLNDGESVTIQCNHVLSGDQVMAHSFTFSNHGGELCGREFNAAQKNEEAPETQPVICEKCGNDMSVDKRTGGCVSNYCPWCGTRKPKTI